MESENTRGSTADENNPSCLQTHRAYATHCHGHASHHNNPMTLEDAVRSLLLLAQVALDSDDYESAAEAFASILQIEPNEVASYNLGSFHARGLGVRQDYIEGARLFHQAELMGNYRAGKLCGKCMLDYVCDGFYDKSPAELYAKMAVFVSRVYPQAADQKLEVNHGLIAIAMTFLNMGKRAEAAKVLRAAAEFGNDEYAREYLAEL